MKPKRGSYANSDENWIHTEVLGQRKKPGFFSNLMVGVVLIVVIILIVLAFQNMFNKNDLSNLENLDAIKPGDIPEEQVKEEKKEDVVEDLKYTVGSGDTLAGIGLQFDVEWQKIAERNGLQEPYALEVGQELVIPGVKAKTEPVAEEAADDKEKDSTPVAGEGTYVVTAGDTLALIGYNLGIPWEEIAKLNGLEPPYALEIDQVLRLP